MLWTSKTKRMLVSASTLCGPWQLIQGDLTPREDDPYEIHEEVVYPEIIGFRSEVGQSIDIVVK